MSSVHRGAVVGSIQRLFDNGTLVALGERQLLERFLSQHDEGAFEAIVGRHGPMVLSVCWRVLDDRHDVEDAFQATFLILVKKASSIRDRDVLGTWLYRVARRVAVRARTNSRHRQSHERIGLEFSEVPDVRKDPVEANEIRAVVDDELERLPYRYRSALVLCDMEGQTHEQAAVQLRCPVGTVKSRLSRARERLRFRLARRGLATPLFVPGSLLATDPASAVPVKLLSHTIKAATGLATKGAVTAGTALLTEGVIRTMAITTPKIASVMLLATTVAIGGAWLTIGLRPSQRALVENAPAQTAVAANLVDGMHESRQPANPESEQFQPAQELPVEQNPIREAQKPDANPPKRGALRLARLKHDGDWNIADQAIPKLMEGLRKPPLNFDVVISPKDLSASDPNVIYYPLIFLQGSGRFSLPNQDLEALRQYLEPDGGTIIADANLGSAAFDASFRRLVTLLFPAKTLVPIPKDDELYSTKVCFDLSKVQFTKAAGGKRDFPVLEGVKINDRWVIIYSKYDISSALEGKNEIKSKGYAPESARKIAANIVVYAMLP